MSSRARRIEVASKVEADQAWCNLVNRWDASEAEVWLGDELLFCFQRLSSGEPVLLKPANQTGLFLRGQDVRAA